MKKLLILTLVLFFSLTLSAQRGKNYEKVRSMKVAYLTEKLNLSVEEAEKFWPVYNEYTKQSHDLRREFAHNYLAKYKNTEIPESVSNDEVNNFIEAEIALDEKLLIMKKEYYKKLREILDANKILVLGKSEMEFNKKLIKELRHRDRK